MNKRRKKRIRRFRAHCLRFLAGGVLCFGLVWIFMVAANAFGSIENNPAAKMIQNDKTSTSGNELTVNRKNATDSEADLLILVNKDHPLPDDYQVELMSLQNGLTSVAASIYEHLKEMLTDGSEEGLEFCVASGYRSVESQQKILDHDITALMQHGMTYEEAYEEKTRVVMPPGYSEHESGLAVDITALSNQQLDDTQEYTPENKWLQQNCAKYGFILRYPRGKEDITDIDYESWHYRYVGVEAAQYIMDHNLTLEEYLEEK